MKVLVGLGNPGQTFRETRHNIGFKVMTALAERHQVSLTRPLADATGRPTGVVGAYQDGRHAVTLCLPLTMMNESGQALGALEVSATHLLIVCDDARLPLGALRLRSAGSDGGHHGLASCLTVLGTEAVARLRVGIGAEDMPEALQAFVLAPFAPAERPLVQRMVQQAADACETWVREGIDVAMNRYNVKAQEA